MAKTSGHASKVTIEHEEIRRWAEERGGKPVHVKGTGADGDVGIIRIDFPGYTGEGKLEPIGWEEWFEEFEKKRLALVYEETTREGQRSSFNKLVSRDSVKDELSKEHTAEPKTRHAG